MSKPVFGRASAPKAAATPSIRMLAPADLRAKGIHYHPNYLRTLWVEGRFPKPIYLSARKYVWPEPIIDKWIQDKIKLAELGAARARV
jgi:hypothetical protein